MKKWRFSSISYINTVTYFNPFVILNSKRIIGITFWMDWFKLKLCNFCGFICHYKLGINEYFFYTFAENTLHIHVVSCPRKTVI